MSVTQVYEALGQFEVELLGNVPREVLDNISHFDHIAIIPGRVDPRQYGDGCLNAARYVGVVRKKNYKDDGRTLKIQDNISIEGVGMEFWLGDEDGKGAVIETPLEFNSASFNTVINALRPISVSNGTIYTVTGSYTGRHVYQTPRDAIKYVCDTMSTTAVPVGYRVNNNATLDAGPESSLFVTNPTCIIVRKGGITGEDLFLKALPTNTNMEIDMEDFATRVVMLAESDGENLATGSADIATIAPGVNIYKDMFGNSLKLTKLVNESDTLETNADTRAELALREVIDPHRTLQTSLEDYDVYGTFNVGDYVWFYDPDGGLVDTANEVYIRGVRINPVKLRVTEADFPVTNGYTVAHRDENGVWTDLTDYVHFEEDQATQVTIGDFSRELTNTGSALSDRTNPVIVNNSIPGTATWSGSPTTTNYLDGNGYSKASIAVAWNAPTNTDGTAITDGDRFELNLRKSGDSLWTVYNVPWGTTSFQFNDLAVATTYEFRVRAFDIANNAGGWSTTQSQLSSSDGSAPSTPAAPVVAASTIAIQVVHQLGKASGGTYNLENDLAELEVHLGTSTGFTPSSSTYIGSLRANKGMMAAGVPAVGTFPVSNVLAIYIKVIAVDTSGNKSAASAEASTTALLVDNAHISDLTVTKVTAGTISANWLLGAAIRTAASGQRVELNSSGIQLYDSFGNTLVNIDAATGQFTLKTANSGSRMEFDATGIKTYDANGDLSTSLNSDPASASGDYIRFRDSTGASVAAISQEGIGSFDKVYADQNLYVGGQDIVADIINEMPRGVLALSTQTASSAGTSGADSAGQKIFNRVIIQDFDPTRMYRVGYSVHLDTQGTFPGYVGFYCRQNTDAATTTASGVLFQQQWGGRYTSSASDLIASGHHMFSNSSFAGTDLHLGFYVYAQIASTRAQGDAWSRVWVEDAGPIINYTAFDPAGTTDGGSGNTTTYTKTYSANWCGRYNGSGSRISSNSDIYQGQYDGTNGNQKSMIGFDYTTIASDLTGATVTKITLTMTNKHWYYNSGGTAVVGTHNQAVASAPTTWSGTANLGVFSGWPLGATWAVTLDNTIGTALKNGTAKGIVIGPGNDTSKTYYGYFAGSNDSTNKPKLTITYTK